MLGVLVCLLIIAFTLCRTPQSLYYGVGLILLCLFLMFGFVVIQPNMALGIIFFGKYKGTIRREGFMWINPFMLSRQRLSLRLRNMDIAPIKVNDKIGNPVMIGMVLVWKISDTYKVMFDLDSDDLGDFVRIQSDAALREVTGHYAYDNDNEQSKELTLRDGGDEINQLLESKLNERLSMAGISVVEARINYLAYSSEIAAVMLRRQQAAAIITAREKIVEGAVSMVEMALDGIEKRGIVKLSDDKKADMVGNLLVVLCSDDSAQPVMPV